MKSQGLYPLKLKAALHIKVWGGRALETQLGKALPSDEAYGEAWELHDSCLVTNGYLRGQSLGALTRQFGASLVGAGHPPADGFPLLAKFIDARDWLSVQAHPDDQQARELEGESRGKTEAWLVLDAEPGAQLVIGLRPGTTRAQAAEAIRRGTLESLLEYAGVAAGDLLYIPAGMVHALGPGILVYEIQQSSNTTYRLYDWGRLGLDGQPRQLHIDKGLRVANLELPPPIQQPKGDLLVECEYFRAWRHALAGAAREIATGGKFQALTCISGSLRVAAPGHQSLQLDRGETGLIPACLFSFTLCGEGVVLRACPA